MYDSTEKQLNTIFDFVKKFNQAGQIKMLAIRHKNVGNFSVSYVRGHGQ